MDASFDTERFIELLDDTIRKKKNLDLAREHPASISTALEDRLLCAGTLDLITQGNEISVIERAGAEQLREKLPALELEVEFKKTEYQHSYLKLFGYLKFNTPVLRVNAQRCEGTYEGIERMDGEVQGTNRNVSGYLVGLDFLNVQAQNPDAVLRLIDIPELVRSSPVENSFANPRVVFGDEGILYFVKRDDYVVAEVSLGVHVRGRLNEHPEIDISRVLSPQNYHKALAYLDEIVKMGIIKVQVPHNETLYASPATQAVKSPQAFSFRGILSPLNSLFSGWTENFLY